MRFAAKHILKRSGTLAIPVLVCMLCFMLTAAAQTDTSATQQDNNTDAQAYPDSITSFTQFEIPPEMANEFLHMPINSVLLYHNEFQMLHNGMYGQAQVVIKVWYIDDHIVGYIIETPFDHIGGAHVLKRKINIPVTWCCMPAVAGHDQHCVNSLADLRTTTASSKCTGWHIKLPEAFEPAIPLSLQKRPALQPAKGDFGHAEKTDNKAKKKKLKKGEGFQQEEEVKPATDSTATKPGNR